MVGFGLVSVRKVSSFVLIHFLVAMDDDVMVTAVNALTDAVKLMTDAQSSIKVPPPHVCASKISLYFLKNLNDLYRQNMGLMNKFGCRLLIHI